MKQSHYALVFLALIWSSVSFADPPKPAASKSQQSTNKVSTARPGRSPTAARAAGTQLAVPDMLSMIALMRSTVEAVNQGNKTGYYGVVYMLGTESFKVVNTIDNIAKAFKPFRDAGIDMRSALVIVPVLSEPAKIESKKLKINGTFYDKPLSIKFQFEYEMVAGQWRYSIVNIALVSQ